MKKHILVISQYFYPEQFRINDICVEWVNRGYKVTVVTGIPNYPEGKFYDGFGLFKKNKEKYKGIDIIRLPIIPRGNNALMLALNYFSFVISGYFWKSFTAVKADYVFTFEVSPMTQALPGIWYAKKNNIPSYIYVQDLWPENLEIIAGIKNPTILKYVGKMVDYIYEHSGHIFTTSRSFVDSIVDRGVEATKVKYWPQYAEDFYVPIEKSSPNDKKFDIVFTGNIGEAQGLDILINAAKILKNKFCLDDITFTLVGNGRNKDVLIKRVHENGLDDQFNFIDKKPAEEIPEILGESNVAFLSLNNNPIFSRTIPAKLQSYMACGKPILASADGETEKIIKEAKCGIATKSGDAHELAQGIFDLYQMPPDELGQLGKNGRAYYLVNFGKDNLLNQIDTFFSHAKGS